MANLNFDNVYMMYAFISTAFFLFLSFCSEETDAEYYKNRIKELERAHDDNVDDYNQLVDEYNALYEQLADYKKKYDFLQKDDPEFLVDYNDLYAECQDLKEEREALQKRIARLESRLARNS